MVPRQSNFGKFALPLLRQIPHDRGDSVILTRSGCIKLNGRNALNHRIGLDANNVDARCDWIFHVASIAWLAGDCSVRFQTDPLPNRGDRPGTRAAGLIGFPAPTIPSATPLAGRAVLRDKSRRAPRFCLWLLAFLLLGIQAPAGAAVEIAFYSRELGGDNFPHAFVTLRGTLDATGEPVDTSYGFTAKAVTPALLFGSVPGEIVVEGPRQVARSERQFVLTLSDARYLAVMAVVEEWRNRPQPSYNLNRRNCVHFVGALAQAAGLRVDYVQRLIKRPRSFLRHVRSLNPGLAAAPSPQP